MSRSESHSKPSGPSTARIRKASVKAALFKRAEPPRIGRFTLLESIGAGAMGEVYTAYDDQLDRKVALKLVRPDVHASSRADERLLREAQTLAQVSHPNVVQVYEAGHHDGGVFLAMEFIQGQDLSAWLARRGKLLASGELSKKQHKHDILNHFIAAGRGLEAAHQAGLAHRDFKPDNVLVGNDGRVRVVDFGLARAVDEDIDELSASDISELSSEIPISTSGTDAHAQSVTLRPGRRASADFPAGPSTDDQGTVDLNAPARAERTPAPAERDVSADVGVGHSARRRLETDPTAFVTLDQESGSSGPEHPDLLNTLDTPADGDAADASADGDAADSDRAEPARSQAQPRRQTTSPRPAEPPGAAAPRSGWEESSFSDQTASGIRKAALRLTETGTIMGTPRYMPPEQLRGRAADHRSDQFSFCVALFHALYGEWPFPGDDFPKLMRAVLQGQIITPRHANEVPAPVRKAILRGLENDPDDRFPDMGELIQVLERWPQRRRRLITSLTVAGLVGAVAIGGFVAAGGREDPCAAVTQPLDTMWNKRRDDSIAATFANSRFAFASAAWEKTSAIIDDYADSWRSAATEICEDPLRRDSVAHRMCLKNRRDRLDALLTNLEQSPSAAPQEPGDSIIENAINAATALPDPSECRDADSMTLGMEPPPPTIADDVAATRAQLAEARTQELLGRYRESHALAQSLVTQSSQIDYPPLQAEALHQLGRSSAARLKKRDADQVEEIYLDAVDIAEGVKHDQLAREIWHSLVLLAQQFHEDFDHGRAWSRREYAAVRRTGNKPQDRASALHARGLILSRAGEAEAAAEAYREAIEILDDEPTLSTRVGSLYHDFANVERNQSNFEAAVELYDKALELLTRQYGENHPKVGRLLFDFAPILFEVNDFQRAREYGNQAREIFEQTLGPENLTVGMSYVFLTELEAHAGNVDLAGSYAQKAHKIYQATLPRDSVRHAEPFMASGNEQRARRNFAAAHAAYEQAFTIRQQRFQGGYWQLREWSRFYVVDSLIGQGQVAAALEQADEGLAQQQQHDPKAISLRAMLLGARGRAQLGLGNLDAALADLEASLALFRDIPGLANERAIVLWATARALTYDTRPAPARACELAAQARAIFADQGRVARDTLAAIDKLLTRCDAE